MPRSGPPRQVALIQRRLTNYRPPLFNGMRERLARDGITLRLLHGEGTPDEQRKQDGATLDWAEPLSTRYLAGGRVCWQPYADRVRDCALVVVNQENKLVSNLPPLLDRGRPYRLAFWGHGRHMHTLNPDSASERFKRWTNRRVDWYYAYTELSAGFVRDTGFPPERITVLDNAIDTTSLQRCVDAARPVPVPELRRRFGLGDGPVGLYMGSLYAEKRLARVIAAAEALIERVPGFEMVIAGDGPDRPLVEAAAARHPRLHFLGPVYGERKGELLCATTVILNPGMVGLGILDGFVAGIPMATTDCRIHSPEVAYLKPGLNGLMTPDDHGAYVEAVAGLLQRPEVLARIGLAARDDASRYTIQGMVERYSDGILACLAAPRRDADG